MTRTDTHLHTSVVGVVLLGTKLEGNCVCVYVCVCVDECVCVCVDECVCVHGMSVQISIGHNPMGHHRP